MPTIKHSSRSKTKHTKKNTKQNPIIIHISGMSGAEKSTLGRKLTGELNILVIDTDDIDDPNKLLLIPKYSLETDKSRHALKEEVSKLNKTQ